jgi:hypothetical protein
MKNTPASHRLIHGSTRMTIFLLIALLALAGMLMTQRGLFALLGGNLKGSWGSGVVGVSLMTAAFALARYRNDLVDD